MSMEVSDNPTTSGWWKESWFWGLLCLALLVHAPRIIDQPIRGEESRWAQGGLEMIESGNWIVPTQQRTVFPERPPLNSWAMALAATIVGDMNPIAVRLPSLLATLLTCALIYSYSRRWLSSPGAAVVAGVFATFGQVMQLGHLGESEALLTLLIAVSLLGWHGAWVDGHETRAWMIGFTAAALAALTKGIQGPVYFIAVTSIFILIQRRWEAFRVWRSASWWSGFALMVAIIAAWGIPFWLQTNTQAVRDVWTGLVADRVSLQGLIEHLVAFPIEMLVCWLPWSLFLIPLSWRSVRQALAPYQTPLNFAVVALAITFPSVWWVTGARGRYFMPLAPIAAVMIGTIVWVTLAGMTQPSVAKHWTRFARGAGIAGFAWGVALVAAEWLGRPLIPAHNLLTSWVTAAGTLCLATLLLLSTRDVKHDEPSARSALRSASFLVSWRSPRTSFALSLLLLGWIFNYGVVSQELENGDFVRDEVAQTKERLPERVELVSLGPVHHRFAFHWKTPIAMRPWPEANTESPDFEYFVIDYQPQDTAETRISGRGRTWSTTSGTLPFRWEVVDAIPIDREYRESRNWVLVGRVLRDASGQSIAEAQPIPDAQGVRSFY